MSIHLRLLYLAILTFFAIISCEKPPEFPVTPELTGFRSVEFKRSGNGFDSLIVTVAFRDGDGDLGLSGFESDPKYDEVIYQRRSNGEFIVLGDPEAPSEYNVCDFVINPTVNGALIEDTVHVLLNPNHNNIEVNFLLKRGNTYEEFDFRREFGPGSCQSFDGRFPILNSEDFARPLEGDLRYGMVSSGFLPLFGNDTMKLEVVIRDRALNQSNDVISDDFVLNDITITD